MAIVSLTVGNTVTATARKTADLGDPRVSATLGTGVSLEADILFKDTRTVAGGATDALDLTGALTDDFGTALTFATLHAICVRARSTNTTAITVGGGAAPAGAPGATVLRAGEQVNFVSATGWAVTATTADIVQVVNAAGAAADYDIILVGKA